MIVRNFYYGTRYLQIIYDANEGSCGIRLGTRDAGFGTSWKRLDNYGTTSLAELVTAISGASNLSTLANALGVGNDVIVDQSVSNQIEAAYQATNEYTIFQGSTPLGSEGGWYGFKRADDRMSYCILFYDGSGLLKGERNPSTSTWSFKSIA